MNNLPIELITKLIVPFCSESNNLINLKLTCKQYNKNIKSHTFNIRCANCGSHKFSIHNDPNKCYVENCMSKDFIHPFVKYYNMIDQPLCSFGCLLNTTQSRK